MIKNRPFVFLLLFAFIAIANIARPQDEPSMFGSKKADPIFQERGVAIRSYDPVAYFTQSKPMKGKKDFEYEYMGAKWRFVSPENRDAFMKEPEKYLPQYGGYCAFGMSHGYAAPIDPKAWTIVDGKLYLNYSYDVRREWNKNIPELIAKADQNWPKIPKKSLGK